MMWRPYLDEAVGIYNKRDCPGSTFECRGSVKTAYDAFGAIRFLFVPHDARLRKVEAVPMEP